jgi:hypothetical protein
MQVNTPKIARRVASRVVLANSGYALSSDAFDIAEASPFVDEADISLALALACEIASRAEEVVEEGRAYRPKMIVREPTRRFPKILIEPTIERGGFEALYELVQDNEIFNEDIAKYTRRTRGIGPYEFYYKGIMPTNLLEETHVRRVAEAAFGFLKRPSLAKAFNRSPGQMAVGILRDLGVDLKDDQIKLEVKFEQDPQNDVTGKAEVIIDGEVFYSVDALKINLNALQPGSAIAGERYFTSKSDSTFRSVRIDEQLTELAAIRIMQLSGKLSHPDDEVRAQAETWVTSGEGAGSLYRESLRSNLVSKDVRAASRGIYKRLLKKYDKADFGPGDVSKAKKFFGKDLMMLLTKCWNKSEFKQYFGSFEIHRDMLKLLYDIICKRLNVAEHSKVAIQNMGDQILRDVVFLCMVDCALRKIGVDISTSKFKHSLLANRPR